MRSQTVTSKAVPHDGQIESNTVDWNVKAVEPSEDYCLLVETVGVQTGVFDLKPHLDRGAFRELRDPSYFKRVGIVLGAVAWPNGQDIALLAGLVQPLKSASDEPPDG